MPTLEMRRLRGDLIECYKIIKENYDPNVSKNIIYINEDSNTRGNGLKLKKPC